MAMQNRRQREHRVIKDSLSTEALEFDWCWFWCENRSNRRYSCNRYLESANFYYRILVSIKSFSDVVFAAAAAAAAVILLSRCERRVHRFDT